MPAFNDPTSDGAPLRPQAERQDIAAIASFSAPWACPDLAQAIREARAQEISAYAGRDQIDDPQ